MAASSRREFMERAAVCSGLAGFIVANAAELRANPLGLPIGSQVYPLRSMLKDFPTFAKMMAEIGVTRLELCSPIGYSPDFASLAARSGRSWPTMDAEGSTSPTSCGTASKGRRKSVSRR